MTDSGPRPAVDNVVSFAPDYDSKWFVRFETRLDGVVETREVPVFGWAVVVTDIHAGELITSVEPMVIDEGYPRTVAEYRAMRVGVVTWGVFR